MITTTNLFNRNEAKENKNPKFKNWILIVLLLEIKGLVLPGPWACSLKSCAEISEIIILSQFWHLFLNKKNKAHMLGNVLKIQSFMVSFLHFKYIYTTCFSCTIKLICRTINEWRLWHSSENSDLSQNLNF